MKNLNIKLNYTLYMLVMCIFTSCSEIFPTNQKFVVGKIESHNSSNAKYRYWIISCKGNTNFWMATDSLYDVSDTLILNAP